MKLSVVTAGWLFLISVVTANAGVNHINGNFHISYTDIVIQDSLKSVRTYNSKSTYVGLFGFGWNTAFETYLIVGPSGTPILYQYGGGSTQNFKPVVPHPQYEELLNESLTTMEEALIEEQWSGTDPVERESIRNAVREKLKGFDSRVAYWKRLVEQGKIIPPNIPVGTEFKFECSCSFKYHHLVRTEEGYRYTKANTTQLFDATGKLLSLTEGDKAVFLERYQEGIHKGKVQRVRDDKDEIEFFYNESGYVVRLFHPQSGKVAEFTYKADDLIYSRDAGGNIYRYSYDAVHNLTRIEYEDGTSLSLDYDESNFVSRITDRQGAVTHYQYGPLDGDPDLNYYTQIKRVPPPEQGGVVRHERLEYYNRNTAYGNVQVKTVSEADGVRREFIYNDSGILKEISESSIFTPLKNTTRFSFDTSGRATDLTNGYWRRQYDYLNMDSKRVKQRTTDYGVEQSRYRFEYDDKDRIAFAKHAGLTVEIGYQGDSKSIVSSLEKGNDRLTIERDSSGRVVQLNLNNGGDTTALAVTYSSTGKAVIDTYNPSAALQVTGVLLGMLRNIAPAGADVDLLAD